MLSLSQRLAQTQKLSPQQIQYQKLLQLNTLALEQRIKTELEMNPVLEEELEMSLDQNDKEKDTDSETEIEDEYSDKDNEEFALEDYMNDDDFDHERINRSPDEELYQPLAPQRETLSEHLTEQLRLLHLDEDLYILGEEIIGNLDEDGYLKRELPEILNELEMFEHIKVEPQTAEDLLKRIQKFDPIGIASRSLKECLIVQLKESKSDPYNKYLAIKMLEDHYDEFTKRRFDLIKQRMNMTDVSLKDTVELIQTMNPKPGEGNISSMEMNQVTPDFIVEKVDENWVITLNDKSMPSVTISKQYLEMFNSNKRTKRNNRERETYKFLREKFESAKWFIACIQQRRETLMKIMRAILERQYMFFEKGPKFLKPMIYKDIAEEIQMDISTISRVVNGKYVQSPMGIHELKYFFSEGLSTDSGEDVSNKHIRERLKEIIEHENKKAPFSDDRLADLLNAEGIHIARRTVAKYREQLKLPVARLRKQMM
ncbi:MAG TPA: RNA polymerase factor sigma-54 [Ignavibacteriaceae bacterium]|jgi:RNA polymerase sigma-54 factor|nr:MAG: RNA polymerase sigma-54 factor [Ignavibacteria bacterium ADurb.Bin266]OQY75462.1 MAG: RNA polymerase sigma-54 factor [Ignavibacteriales bacterium UTCHB2]HQF42019.1 RNA polymerase factor sigma-54 [Ignavibacteriaceae bacterium]HQI39671.1 RNA polymerase factor sigma-54 [Ignavibacteriaceae bacterium]HQJ45094.1 RNA polymerase factor sigma-54 [Ignavibacteriaceae bacterium]